MLIAVVGEFFGYDCTRSSLTHAIYLVSLLSKDPPITAKAKKMNKHDFLAFALVHTSEQVIKALTTHLDLLEPKLNSFGKPLQEFRRILDSNGSLLPSANGKDTVEADVNDADQNIEGEEGRIFGTDNAEQNCSPGRNFSNHSMESICEDSDWSEQNIPSELRLQAVRIHLRFHGVF